MAHALLEQLWTQAGADVDFCQRLQFTGSDIQLPSTFAVGTLASASIAAQALAAQQLWETRGGVEQQIRVDQRHALAMFRSERYLRIDSQVPEDTWSPLTGYYPTGDGRWIQLHTHFPHHSAGVLQVLDSAATREAVAAAILRWKAEELEAVLAQAGMCAAMIRTEQEWAQHPQAQAIAALPVVEIRRIGDAPVQRLPSATRPLLGIRVLDLSRVIAAPVAARTLAQHGADVLAVGAAHLPEIPLLVMDTGRGKRNTRIDLRSAPGLQQVAQLMQHADVFLQAYRPGALAQFGLDAETLAARYPGIVVVGLSAYGQQGPWSQRRGFDSLVQSASGIADTEGQAAHLSGPGKLPCQALDHATGYLAAFATMIALHRRATEGGSWQVRVSLAQTGRLLQSLPRYALNAHDAELTAAEIAAYSEITASGFGQMQAIRPVEHMPACQPYFFLPAMPRGTHVPQWGQGT
ncbi:CoA transferase [Undibacterium crateris]|uniref:CoA transferase n=1 Tax=Undibacterium crateris TaxID=2528175 RepID=UPI001389AE16|nr:CoA transferase [Undibacterium crateris]NDI84814.1 CoA transferase [Undibacterium crateris]